MQRGLVGIAGAAVVSGVGFFVLKRITDLGFALPDVVLMATAATLVLAAAAAVFSFGALIRSRQAHQEIARIARSIDAAMRAVKVDGDRRSISIGERTAPIATEPGVEHPAPALDQAHTVQAKIIALAAALPGEKDAPNGRRH